MIFNGVLVHIFHEIVNGLIWDGEFIKLSYGVFMYIWRLLTLAVMVIYEGVYYPSIVLKCIY